MSAEQQRIYDHYLQTQEIHADDAATLHQRAHDLGQADPSLRQLFYLLEVLAGQYDRGERCAVCCRVNDPDCAERC